MTDSSPRIIGLFYSPQLHQASPQSTYSFGDAPPQTSTSVVHQDGSYIRERVVNIWGQGAEEVLGDIRRQFPDAHFVGTLAEDGHLLLPQDESSQEAVNRAALEALNSSEEGLAGVHKAKAIWDYYAQLEKPLPPRRAGLPTFDENGAMPRSNSGQQLPRIRGLSNASPEIPNSGTEPAAQSTRPAGSTGAKVVGIFSRRQL